MNNPLDEHYMSKVTLTNEVKSPCVRNCCLNDFDVCIGCGRKLEEILAWGSASDDERHKVLERIQEQVTSEHRFFDGSL